MLKLIFVMNCLDLGLFINARESLRFVFKFLINCRIFTQIVNDIIVGIILGDPKKMLTEGYEFFK